MHFQGLPTHLPDLETVPDHVSQAPVNRLSCCLVADSSGLLRTPGLRAVRSLLPVYWWEPVQQGTVCSGLCLISFQGIFPTALLIEILTLKAPLRDFLELHIMHMILWPPAVNAKFQMRKGLNGRSEVCTALLLGIKQEPGAEVYGLGGSYENSSGNVVWSMCGEISFIR